jgi:hypothetical protein
MRTGTEIKLRMWVAKYVSCKLNMTQLMYLFSCSFLKSSQENSHSQIFILLSNVTLKERVCGVDLSGLGEELPTGSYESSNESSYFIKSTE